MPQLPASLVISQLPGAAQSASFTLAADSGGGLEGAQAPSFGAVLGKQIKGIAALLGEGKDSGLPGALLNKDEVVDSTDGGAAPALIAADFSAMMVLATPQPSETQPALDLPQKSVASQSSDLLQAQVLQQASMLPQVSVLPQAFNPSPDTISLPAAPRSTVSAAPLAASARNGLVGRTGMPSVESGSAMSKLDASPAGGAHPAAEIAGNGRSLPQTLSAEDSFAHKFAALVDGAAGKVEQQVPLADQLAAMHHSSAGGGVDASMALRQSGPLPALPVAPRVGSAEWGGAVGEKMMWMANQNHQVAELHLNPPNLGPLEVRLTINNDQASAMFVSQHSAVRDAIETALPRLREMLADNGITLGNASVGSESFGQQQQAFEQRGGGREGGRGGDMMDSVADRVVGNATPVGVSRDGMVDIFA